MAVENSISLADAPQSDYMDDSAIKRKRMLAQQLLLAGADTSPVRHPLQGVARLVQGLMGGIHEARADAAEKENNDYNSKLMTGLLTPEASATGSVTPRASLTPNSPAAQGVAGLGGFNTAVNRTLGFEGGLNPRDSNGSPSNFGINQAANPDVNVRGLSQADAKTLYKQRYWDAIHGDEIAAKNPALAHVAFDTAVIAGPGKANELLNYANGDPMRLLDARERFQNHLLQANPAKYGPYAKAWNDRIAGLRSDVGGGNVAGPSSVAGGGNPVQVASNDAAGAFGAAAPTVPAAQNGQAARLLAAMADPRLSAQNKQILQLMYKQAVGNDGSHRHVVNGALVDDSGNVLYKGETKPEARTELQRDLEYAQAHPEAMPYFEKKYGAAPKVEKPTLASQAAERAAVADQYGLKGDDRNAFILNGKAPTNAEKAPTGEQANAANFATRMRESDKIISDPALMDAVTLKQKAADSIPFVGNYLTSDHFKQMDQAQRDFVNATLRRESGASISAPEFENAKRQYFPQPGDTPAVIAQKARNRQTAMEGIANAAVPAFREQFFGERNPNVVKRADERSAAPAGTTKSGVKWTVE